MSEGFDPYHKWLGIPPKHQPPHHYRLLGIDPFEDDPDVISNAADQRMALLRSFQSGKHAEISQRLLNEIAAARVCLLNAERKKEYDARLRATLVAASPGSPGKNPAAGVAAPPMPRPTPQGLPVARPLAPAAAPPGMTVATPAPMAVRRERARPAGGPSLPAAGAPQIRPVATQGRGPNVLLIGLALATLAAVLTIALVLVRPGNRVEVAEGSTPPATEAPPPESSPLPAAPAAAQPQNTEPAPMPGEAARSEATDAANQNNQPDDASAPVTPPAPEDSSAANPPAPLPGIWVPQLPRGAVLSMAFPPDAFHLEKVGTKIPDLTGLANDGVVTRFLSGPNRPTRPIAGVMLPKTLLQRQPSYTLVAWYRYEESPEQEEIFAEYVPDGPIYKVYVTTEGKLGVDAWCFGHPNAWIMSTTPEAVIRPGEWTFLAVRMADADVSRGTARLTVNDRELELPSQLVQHPRQVPVPWIGPGLRGPLAALAIFHRALSDEEIARLRAQRPDVTPSAAAAQPDPLARLMPQPPPRLDVPAPPDRDAALRRIRKDFADDYRKAIRPDAKAALARILARLADEENDPTLQYVLLLEAQRLAADAGDIDQAFAAADQLAAVFEVDRWETLLEAARGLLRAAGSADQRLKLAEALVPRIDAAAEQHAFAAAAELQKLAVAAARCAGALPLVRQLVDRTAELDQQAKTFAAMEPALQTLRSDPEDEAANLAVGRYLCLVRGQWELGLAILAKGGADKLAAAARRELQPPTDAAGRVALADLWWELAGPESSSPEADEMLARAAYHYHRALEQLEPAARAGAQQRFAEAARRLAASSRGRRMPPGAVLIATFEPEAVSEHTSQTGKWTVRNRARDNEAGELTGTSMRPGVAGQAAWLDGTGWVCSGRGPAATAASSRSPAGTRPRRPGRCFPRASRIPPTGPGWWCLRTESASGRRTSSLKSRSTTATGTTSPT